MGEGRSLAGIGMRKSDSRVKGASRGAENFKRGWLDVDVTVAAADPPRKVPHNLFYDTGLAMTMPGSTIACGRLHRSRPGHQSSPPRLTSDHREPLRRLVHYCVDLGIICGQLLALSCLILHFTTSDRSLFHVLCPLGANSQRSRLC